MKVNKEWWAWRLISIAAKTIEINDFIKFFFPSLCSKESAQNIEIQFFSDIKLLCDVVGALL